MAHQAISNKISGTIINVTTKKMNTLFDYSFQDNIYQNLFKKRNAYEIIKLNDKKKNKKKFNP